MEILEPLPGAHAETSPWRKPSWITAPLTDGIRPVPGGATRGKRRAAVGAVWPAACLMLAALRSARPATGAAGRAAGNSYPLSTDSGISLCADSHLLVGGPRPREARSPRGQGAADVVAVCCSCTGPWCPGGEPLQRCLAITSGSADPPMPGRARHLALQAEIDLVDEQLETLVREVKPTLLSLGRSLRRRRPVITAPLLRVRPRRAQRVLIQDPRPADPRRPRTPGPAARHDAAPRPIPAPPPTPPD